MPSASISAPVASETAAVERQQRDQRMLARWAESSRDQDGTEFVAVHPDGVRLIIQPRPPYMRCGRMVKEFFLDGIPVEPRHGAQPADDGGPGPAAGLPG